MHFRIASPTQGQFIEMEEKKIPFIEWFEWFSILLALVFLTITEVFQPYIVIGLLLLLLSTGSRIYRTKRIFQPTGLELPLLFFVVSACFAAWIAFDQRSAFLQLSRILAAVVLFYAIIESHPFIRYLLLIILVTLAVFLALYWPLQHSFSNAPVKFNPINQLGLWINNNFNQIRLTEITGERIHANVAAGTLALVLPFSIALINEAWNTGKKLFLSFAILSASIILIGLILTSSRGAWMGTASACLIFTLAGIQRQWFFISRDKLFFWGIFTFGIILFFGYFLVFGDIDFILGQIPDPTGSLMNRSALWREGIGLIRDYPFTGSGLRSFWLIHSTYALLIPVHLFDHVHNSFLEVWIEQGIIGAISVLSIVLIICVWGWKALDRNDLPNYAYAGFFSLIVLGVQGIVDVVFYIERTLPLIGISIGYAWFFNNEKYNVKDLPVRKHQIRWMGLFSIFGVFVIALVFFNPLTSLYLSNLGSINQSQIELSNYNPDNYNDMTLDKIRRTKNLSPAQGSFNLSLVRWSRNPTALNRLAQIDMSLKAYDAAQTKMDMAWERGNWNNVTRLLYSDALVANGEIEEAAQLLQEIPAAQDRLLYQSWYRYIEDFDYMRASYALQTVLLINPENTEAQIRLEKVQELQN